MKLTEVKHKHLLTDILKVLLFSIIMLVPILSVATRCLYVICNKNAYQSAEITQTTYNKVETENVKRFRYENDDERTIDGFTLNYFSIYGQLLSFNNFNYDTGYLDEKYLDNELTNGIYTFINIAIDNAITTITITIGDNEDDYINFVIEDVSNYVFDFIYISSYEIQSEVITYEFYIDSPLTYYHYEEVQATTLDNVFEYSVNKLNDNPLINWTQQTAIYTGVNTMTTQLGITNAVIPMLIVYWFLMTVIYIIIDIVIKLFTYLTHMIGNKTT